MAEEKTFYAVVGLPFALWALQKVAESAFAFRLALRARLLDTTQLLNDVETNLKATREMIATMEAQLAGSPSPLEDRLKADKDYYIFSVSAQVTVEVFQSDAVQRYSHLDSMLFNNLKQFYDLQKIIAASFVAAMSDRFVTLSVPRKLAAVRQILGHLSESVAVAEKCRTALIEEIEAFHRSWLWRALLLSHWKSKRLREQSGDGAT